MDKCLKICSGILVISTDEIAKRTIGRRRDTQFLTELAIFLRINTQGMTRRPAYMSIIDIQPARIRSVCGYRRYLTVIPRVRYLKRSETCFQAGPFSWNDRLQLIV